MHPMISPLLPRCKTDKNPSPRQIKSLRGKEYFWWLDTLFSTEAFILLVEPAFGILIFQHKVVPRNEGTNHIKCDFNKLLSTMSAENYGTYTVPSQFDSAPSPPRPVQCSPHNTQLLTRRQH